MKLRNLAALALLAIPACAAETNAIAEPEQDESTTTVAAAEQRTSSTETEAASTETTAAEAPADPWTDFWTEFQAAVAADDAEKVAELSLDPLPLGDSNIPPVSKTELVNDFDLYFSDPIVKAAFATPAERVQEMDTTAKYTKRFNSPEGETIRFVQPRVADKSFGFIFGEEADGTYKLRSLSILQH